MLALALALALAVLILTMMVMMMMMERGDVLFGSAVVYCQVFRVFICKRSSVDQLVQIVMTLLVLC